MNRGAQRLEEGGASQCEVVQRERAKMTLARSTLLLLLSVSTCSSALLHAMRCIGPTRAPPPVLGEDIYDDDEDANLVPSTPRGFGVGFGVGVGFGSALDEVDDLIAAMEDEDKRDGATLSAESRQYRNKVLLKWADFVRTAGAGSKGPKPTPLIELRDASVELAGERVLDGVSWEVCQGQLIGVIGESGCGKSTQLRLLAGELSPCAGSVVRHQVEPAGAEAAARAAARAKARAAAGMMARAPRSARRSGCTGHAGGGDAGARRVCPAE